VVSVITHHVDKYIRTTTYNILTMSSLYILEVICFIKKYTNFMVKNIYIHNHMWRKLNLHVQHCNTVIFKKIVMTMDISLYSKVPDQIKLRENFTLFKKCLKFFLLKHSFYSVEELCLLKFLIYVGAFVVSWNERNCFSFNFSNFGCSAYSGNRNFICRFVLLYPFIVVNGMFVMCTQFVHVSIIVLMTCIYSKTWLVLYLVAVSSNMDLWNK
jgi:hypothetical protein